MVREALGEGCEIITLVQVALFTVMEVDRKKLWILVDK